MFENLREKLNNLSIYEANSIIYYFSKVMGQAFVTVQKNNKTKFTISIMNVAYNFIIFFLYLLCFLFAFQDTQSTPTTDKFPVISVMGYYIHYYLGFLLCFTASTYKLNRIKYGNTFINDIINIDYEIQNICDNFKINYYRTFRFQFLLILIGSILFILTGIFDYLVFSIVHGGLNFYVGFSYIVPYLLTAVIQAQFIVAVHSILERYKILNRFLRNISKTNHNNVNRFLKNVSKVSEIPVDDLKLTEIEGNLILPRKAGVKNEDITTKQPVAPGKSFKIWTSIKNFFNIDNDDVDMEESEDDLSISLYLKMNELFTIHDKLFEIAEKINDIYAVQLVISISVSFILTLFGFFFETKVLFWVWDSNTQLIYVSTSYLIWGVLTTLIIYMILNVCTSTREEANESALIVHKILQNKPAFMLNDEIYYNKMKSFTLQILHRKNVFQFSGLGLFNLDYTFIFSAVSAATSYLIVLLQFDLSADFNKFAGKTNTTKI